MAKRANTAFKNLITNAGGDDYNTGKFRIYTGAQPASGDDAASGTLLVEITLPADAFDSAAAGVAAKLGTWSNTATAAGDAGWFRMLNSALTRSVDGSVTVTGGGGDLTLDNISIGVGQSVTINTFTYTGASGA